MKCSRCGFDDSVGHNIPYRIGTPSQRILKYLEMECMNTLAKIMNDTGLVSLHDASCAISDLLRNRKIGKVVRNDGIPEFYYIDVT